MNDIKLQWYIDYMSAQEALDGNMQAWETLYLNSYPLVYNYVAKIHSKWHITYEQIDDVVSEAFERCYKNLSSFQGRSKFSTWVCGFCRYIMLGNYSKFIKHNNYIFEIYNVGVPSYFFKNPEDIIIEKELKIG